MTTLNQSQLDNCWFAHTTRFYKNVDLRNKRRIKHLSLLLRTGRLSKTIKHAGRFAGRQPSLHIETGLLERVENANLGQYVQQFDKFQTADFQKELLNAEKLMTNQCQFKGDLKKLINATCRVAKACKFPNYRFQPVSISYAAKTQINLRSSSGYPLYQRKGRVIRQLIKEAKCITSRSKHWNQPITRGFRIQLRSDVNKVKVKLRVMYPYPGSIILLEDTFIIPFVRHFINTDTFYVIGRNGKKISELLRRKLSKSRRILSSDVSAFDQNMLNETIIMAFSILRNQLKLTKKQAEIFEAMVSYFCVSLACSKVKGSPAYGFIKTHGVPSGSGFTNMIDTLAHAIVLEYLEPNILDNCLICGDDNIVNLSQSVDTENLFRGYEQIFNLPISREKTDLYNSPKKIKFLGFVWKNFIRLVDTRLVINQMLWHTDFYIELSRYDRELARAASVLLNGANGCDLFSKLFPDVIQSLKNGVDVRFVYLFGYQPPTTLPGVVSFQPVKAKGPSLNESLILHLTKGWLIR